MTSVTIEISATTQHLAVRLTQLSRVNMGLISSRITQFRSDPRLFRLPPFLALLCMIGGIVWICLLPLDQYSRRTYVSENALLPGQVHTYFTGSEQNIFRAYRHEVSDVLEGKAMKDENGQDTNMWMMATEEHKYDRIQNIFKNAGIKTARQSYKYESAGKTYTGENVYGIVHGPRADGTESIVLVAPIKNINGETNTNGVTLLLTLARYFSRWSLWSKDIILVVTPDTTTGPQAWVDAYHSMHDSANVADLTLKSGHIQGVICIDYPFNHRFENLHIAYDGINGQLPNLDLANIASQIANGQMGIGVSIQNQHEYVGSENYGDYDVRLRTLFTGMKSQALGHATGAHSVFMPYHIDAITLTATGNGWQDEMAFGRTVESMTRSLNNLLEKLHQSFFFYLLLQTSKFVSIGTYLPSAMAIGAGFTIVAIFAWIRSGYEENDSRSGESTIKTSLPEKPASYVDGTDVKIPEASTDTNSTGSGLAEWWKPLDRHLTMPVAYVATVQLLSLLPIYFLTNLQAKYLTLVFMQASVAILAAPVALASILGFLTSKFSSADMSIALKKTQFYTILSSISLLILGLDLTVLATLNFSLSMFLGLACAPLAFVGYTAPKASSTQLTMGKNVMSAISIFLFSPPVIIAGLAVVDFSYFHSRMARPEGIVATLQSYLENEAFAFNVWRAWGIMVGVWAVWVPAWVIGATGVVASFGAQKKTLVTAEKSNGKIKSDQVVKGKPGQ